MLREQQLRAKLAEAKEKYEELEKRQATIEELEQQLNVVKDLRKRLDLVLELRENEAPEVRRMETPKEDDEEDDETAYRSAFVQALKNERALTREQQNVLARAKNAPTVAHLQSEVDADGGYLVPKDIQTQINHYQRAFTALQDHVRVVMTKVLSGERTFEKLADVAPMENISEYDVINDIATPQYERKSFKISTFAGILPVPNTLMQDTDVAIMNELTQFIAKKRVITRNAKILAKLKEVYTTEKAKAVKTGDDLKDVLNVTLDPVFSAGAVVLTNQDGFNFLDKLKNTQGDYLLQRDVVDPTKFYIFGRPIVVLPNKVLPTNGKKVPVYVGNLEEAIILFDRGVYEVTSTNVGGDSFKRNTTDIRVIDRFDVQAFDTEAVVYCEITLA